MHEMCNRMTAATETVALVPPGRQQVEGLVKGVRVREREGGREREREREREILRKVARHAHLQGMIHLATE